MRNGVTRLGQRVEDAGQVEFDWVQEQLAAWALWSASGGVSLPSTFGNIFANRGEPPSPRLDKNCTAHDIAMLAVDAAVRQLPPLLKKPVHCFYRRDMGRRGSAQACGLSENGFDKRLNLAHYHVARLL